VQLPRERGWELQSNWWNQHPR